MDEYLHDKQGEVGVITSRLLERVLIDISRTVDGFRVRLLSLSCFLLRDVNTGLYRFHQTVGFNAECCYSWYLCFCFELI